MRIPDGADFIEPDENNHFNSVFLFHKASKTIHIDDTVLYFEGSGFLLRLLGKSNGKMEFWDLTKGLQKNSQAPLSFQSSIEKILDDWDFDNICAAHNANKIGGAKNLLRETLEKAKPLLLKLSRKWK